VPATIRVTNEVDLEPVLPGSVPPPAKGDFQELLQSVQGHIRQRRRDDAALWRACLRGEQGSIFNVAGFQPAPQNFRVRGNLIQHPLVTEIIEAAANIAFQNPRRVVAATPASERRDDGFTVFHPSNMKELVPVSSPAVLNVRVPQTSSEATDCDAFWRKPVSVFSLLRFTVLSTVHLCWTCPSA
jgi:hypothetical protein